MYRSTVPILGPLRPSALHRALVQVDTRGASGGGAGNFQTVSLGDIQQDGNAKSESGINVMRSIKSAQLAEAFYFPTEAKDYCRLCDCEVNTPPRMHIAASSRQSHTNHTCREVAFDSLTLLGRKGYCVDNIIAGWAHSLFVHDEFPRIHALTDWTAPVEVRAAAVTKLLHMFKDLGMLDLSLAVVVPSGEGSTEQHYHSRRKLAFERLENIGDNSWGANLSKRMTLCFPDRQWTNGMASYTFNCFRDACEMNLNLEMVYDLLDLGSLLTEQEREKLGTGKVRSDVLESLLGELVMFQYGYEPEIYDTMPFYEVNGGGQMRLHCLVEHTLTEIFDTMFLNYVRQLIGTAVPLSKELASKHVWAVEFPAVTPAKDRTGAARKREGAYSRRKVQLPADAPLHNKPTPFPPPSERANPLRFDPSLVPDAIDSFRGTDVFARMLPSVVKSEELLASRRTVPSREGIVAGRLGQLSPPPSHPPLKCTSERSAVRLVDADRLNFRGLNDNLGLAIGDGAVEMLLRMGGDGGMGSQLYYQDIMFDLSPKRGGGSITPPKGLPVGPGDIAERPIHMGAPVAAGVGPEAHNDAKPPPLSPIPSAGDVNNMLFGYPHLAKEREGIHALPGFSLGGGTVCMFQQSELIPDDIKPPAAGAITDKNLHFGLYLGAVLQGILVGGGGMGGAALSQQGMSVGAGGGVSVTNAPLTPDEQSQYF